ncbi:unnamed protein product, partial [Musa acuminata var. zebrina]
RTTRSKPRLSATVVNGPLLEREEPSGEELPPENSPRGECIKVSHLQSKTAHFAVLFVRTEKEIKDPRLPRLRCHQHSRILTGREASASDFPLLPRGLHHGLESARRSKGGEAFIGVLL